MLRGLIYPFFPIRTTSSFQTSRCLFIASIGNPEPEYANTRHNIAHRLMDQLINVYWKDHVYKKGPYYYASHKYPNIVLFKSDSTLMNIQGRTIQKHFQKFDKESHLLILHDEIELTLGKFQFRKPGSSSRGHNGLKSIDGVYKNKFSKLGIGVGKPNGNNIVRHVLGKFSEEELQILDYEVLPKVVEKLEDTIATTLSTLSSKATTLSSKAR